MKNNGSTVKVEITDKFPGDIDQLLSRIFWRDKELVPLAHEFLDTIKEWSRSGSPYGVDQWDNYCLKKKITQSTYHNMLKRLKRTGMIEKKYNKTRSLHELYISDRFSDYVKEMGSLWDDFRSR